MSKDDPEKRIFDLLKQYEDAGDDWDKMIIPIKDIKNLIARLGNYRDRIHSNSVKHNRKMSQMQAEYDDMKTLMRRSKARLDPEGQGTHISRWDQAEVANAIAKIEELRGHVIAQRLIYGKPVDIDCETKEVLEAAVKDVNNESAKYWAWLKRARESRRTSLVVVTE